MTKICKTQALNVSHQSIYKKCGDEIQSKQDLIVFEDLKEVINENWSDGKVEKWTFKNKSETYSKNL